MPYFVWTKMQAEGGQTLASILALKEAERSASGGVFWWGVGSSLGPALREAAEAAGGTLPVIFSMMRSTPRKTDSHPDQVYLWESWQAPDSSVHEIPKHILEWSRGLPGKKSHYALVCKSLEPITFGDLGRFDPSIYQTHLGNPPGASQVTALLKGDLDGDNSAGMYNITFRATLVAPWMVKLVKPRPFTMDERSLHSSWKKGGDWNEFVMRFRDKS